MTRQARLWLIAVGLVCGIYGLSAIAIYSVYFGRLPWQDWMVYYTAARDYLTGNLPLIYDGERFTAQMNADFAAWLPKALSFHPWLYPPSYLLVVIPFGLLPFATACVIFLVSTFAVLVLVVWRSVGGGYRRWVHLFALLLAPAVWFNIGTGQNAFLSSALLVGGIALLPERPLLGGMLLGLLTYKPQLWLMVPVALVASRNWRGLGAAIVTAAVIALISVAVVGIEPWRVWVDWFLHAPPEIYQTWLKWGRLHGESIYTNLVLVGASHQIATAGQFLATVLSAAVVWLCWAGRMPVDLRLAVLLAATMLAAPHVINYDAVLLVIAGTLLFVHGLDNGMGYGELAVVPVLAWMIQLFDPPDAFRIGLITPVLTTGLIVCAVIVARRALPATFNSCVPVVGAPRAIGGGRAS